MIEHSNASPVAPAPAPQSVGPILSVRNLVKEFPANGSAFATASAIRAVSDVSFDIARGETLGLVGESGCGKSTLSKCILRLTDPSSGAVYLDGVDLAKLSHEEMRQQRRRIQVVFQDPSASLHPRMRVGDIVAEPLRMLKLNRNDMRARVEELFDLVNLSRDYVDRFPHQLSGGQRQRVGIARALAIRPELILLDEPVSALDVSIQAGVLNLLSDLQQKFGLSYLFVAHNLSTVRHISQRVAVMYLGKIVEVAPRDEIFTRPRHPYTHALLSAVPMPDPEQEKKRRRVMLQGDPPSPANPPTGCRFRTRCWKTQALCSTTEPPMVQDGHVSYACHFPMT